MARKTAAEKAADHAAEEAAAEQAAAATVHQASEKKRMIWAGLFLGAVAIFAGGYAVGQSQDETLFAGDVEASVFQVPGDFFSPDQRHPGRFFPQGHGPVGHLPKIGHGRGGEGHMGGRGPGLGGECPFGFGDGRGERPYPPSTDGEIVGDPGFLGVHVSETPRGVVVADVLDGSPADEAGLETDDRIIAVGRVDIESVDHLIELIADAGAGAEVIVTVERFGAEVRLVVVLGVPPG